MHEELKRAVCEANIELQRWKLVIYSWGNVSGIDRAAMVRVGRMHLNTFKMLWQMVPFQSSSGQHSDVN